MRGGKHCIASLYRACRLGWCRERRGSAGRGYKSRAQSFQGFDLVGQGPIVIVVTNLTKNNTDNKIVVIVSRRTIAVVLVTVTGVAMIHHSHTDKKNDTSSR